MKFSLTFQLPEPVKLAPTLDLPSPQKRGKGWHSSEKGEHSQYTKILLSRKSAVRKMFVPWENLASITLGDDWYRSHKCHAISHHLAGFKFGNFPQTRQFAKLKNLAKISCYTVRVAVVYNNPISLWISNAQHNYSLSNNQNKTCMQACHIHMLLHGTDYNNHFTLCL